MLLKIEHVEQEQLTDRQTKNRQTNHDFLSWSKNFPNGMGPESSLPVRTLLCVPRSSE
jgi:hypothetical protein